MGQVFTKGRLSIPPNSFMNEQYRLTFQHLLSSEWPDIAHKTLSIAEIGCGSGSALQHLGDLIFSRVDYVWIDVSSKFMSTCDVMPNSELLEVSFVRAPRTRVYSKTVP